MPCRYPAMVSLSILIITAGFASASPQNSADQRKQIAEINKRKAQVNGQITGRKYDEAAATLGQLQEAIDKLKADGMTDKDPLIINLQKYVDNQKKVLDRHRPKEGRKGDSPGSTSAAGGVSFVKEVAPILSRNCQRCHGQTNPRSKFNLATFNDLMKGGERGSDAIVPGKPDESRLVLMLKGEEDPRMPQGGRALRGDLIELVEKWVKEGAKFDGTPKFTPSTPLADIVPSEEEERRAKIAAMSDSDLLELHKALAKEHWAASNPSKTPEFFETDQFIVAGTVPVAELEQVAQWAEAALRDLNRIFGKPKESIWRGKLTIHVFASRHEYTEHAMVVENREVPRELFGHSYSMIETSYAAVPKPHDDDPASLEGLVAEQVANSYLAALGDTPLWFNTGVARLVAARSDPRADIYREYRQRVREVVGDGDPVKALFEYELEPGVLGFGLVDFLVTLRGGDRLLAVLAGELRKKTAADKAIQTVYGMDAKTLAAHWAQFALKRYPAQRKR